MTLHDLMPCLKGKRLEGLISSETKDLISQAMGLNKSPTKKQIALYLAEACSTSLGQADIMSAQTLELLKSILIAVQEHLNQHQK